MYVLMYMYTCVYGNEPLFVWFYTCDLSTLVTCHALWSRMHMTKKMNGLGRAVDPLMPAPGDAVVQLQSMTDIHVCSTSVWKVCMFVNEHKEIFNCNKFSDVSVTTFCDPHSSVWFIIILWLITTEIKNCIFHNFTIWNERNILTFCMY